MPAAISHIMNQLATARRSKGYTQLLLGQKMGVPQSHVSKIETGVVDVGLSTLIEMARVLDLEVMLVPRKLVPAVRGMQQAERGKHADEPARERPAYRLDDGDDEEDS